MIKTLALIVRRPDISREEFRAHYEEIHAPLAVPLLSGLLRYCRNHIVEELHGKPAFDVLSAFEYEDVAAAATTFARIQTSAGDAIRADELTFMAPPRNVFFFAPPVTRVEGAEGVEHFFVLVRAPANGRDAWLAEHDEKSLPALLDALDDVVFAVEHATARAGPDAPPWDRVTQIRAAGPGALASWIRERESRAARVLVLRTRCNETPGLG